MQDDLTLPDGAVRIPLRARDGTVRAYAIVDAADADWANQWRWSLVAGGYAGRTVLRRVADQERRRKTTVLLHRELLDLRHGDLREGDHQDRDRLNCRRSNLRIVPGKQFGNPNSHNQSSHRDSTSAFRGVMWNKRDRRWQATVVRRGKIVFSRLFKTEQEAAEAAATARSKLLQYALD